MAERIILTPQRLCELLEYNPVTGIFRWHNPKYPQKTDRAGWLNSRGYWCLEIKGVQYKQHQLAWFYMTEEWPNGEIDHINRNPSDNRWINLKDGTHEDNMKNYSMPKTNTSGTMGVMYHKRNGTWIVQVFGEYLGSFRNKEDAITVAETFRVEVMK